MGLGLANVLFEPKPCAGCVGDPKPEPNWLLPPKPCVLLACGAVDEKEEKPAVEPNPLALFPADTGELPKAGGALPNADGPPKLGALPLPNVLPPLPKVLVLPNVLAVLVWPNPDGLPNDGPLGTLAAPLKPNIRSSRLYFFARFRNSCSSLPAYLVSNLSTSDIFDGFFA